MQIVAAAYSLAGAGGSETYLVTVADHLQRGLPAFFCQRDPLMFLILNKRRFCGGKFLHHSSNRWRADIEFLGKRVGTGCFAVLSQFINVFQVILN